MYQTLAFAQLSVVTTMGVVTPIQPGTCFPAYDLKSWKCVNPYRFQMAGLYRDSNGFLTASGEYCPLYVASHEDQASNEASLAGTWLGVRRETVPSRTVPHPGLAMWTDGTYRQHNFTISQFRELTNKVTMLEANLPYPRWWVETDDNFDGCVLTDSTTGGEVRVKEVTWIPWAVDPLENLPEQCEKNSRKYISSVYQWALDEKVGRLYAGYRHGEVGVGKICLRSRPIPKDKLNLQEIFANVAMRKTAALMNGLRYHDAHDTAAWDLDTLLPEVTLMSPGGQVGSIEVLSPAREIPPSFDFLSSFITNGDEEEDEEEEEKVG